MAGTRSNVPRRPSPEVAATGPLTCRHRDQEPAAGPAHPTRRGVHRPTSPRRPARPDGRAAQQDGGVHGTEDRHPPLADAVRAHGGRHRRCRRRTGCRPRTRRPLAGRAVRFPCSATMSVSSDRLPTPTCGRRGRRPPPTERPVDDGATIWRRSIAFPPTRTSSSSVPARAAVRRQPCSPRPASTSSWSRRANSCGRATSCRSRWSRWIVSTAPEASPPRSADRRSPTPKGAAPAAAQRSIQGCTAALRKMSFGAGAGSTRSTISTSAELYAICDEVERELTVQPLPGPPIPASERHARSAPNGWAGITGRFPAGWPTRASTPAARAGAA